MNNPLFNNLVMNEENGLTIEDIKKMTANEIVSRIEEVREVLAGQNKGGN